jgi:hypothetical protein
VKAERHEEAAEEKSETSREVGYKVYGKSISIT